MADVKKGADDEEPEGTKVVDLAEYLRRSVEGRSTARGDKKAVKKMAKKKPATIRKAAKKSARKAAKKSRRSA
ncbi:MAG: hypothetical protein V4733_11590 [Verrucomicrobiota bacterium]